jgi:cob(I)alamin adenosyltransferase
LKPANFSGKEEDFKASSRRQQIMKGYVQVYTGDGKGKTTAALGLALRAAGAGLKVFIAQFLKRGDYSEIKALKKLSEQITVAQYGLGHFVKGKPAPEDMEAAQAGLRKVKSAVTSGAYDLVIIEEGNVAVQCGLFPLAELLDIISEKPEQVELVITGRGASPELIERADLVTEMKEIKHYYKKGVTARIGIEK